MKNNVRHSKYDPFVEEVTLLESNPQYALIRHQDGKESTVSIRQLAPPGKSSTELEKVSEQLRDDETTSQPLSDNQVEIQPNVNHPPPSPTDPPRSINDS